MTADSADRGLIVDYGGVLTSSLARSFRDFEREEGLPKGVVFDIVADAYDRADGDGPIARVERGEINPAQFARLMVAEFADQGVQVASEGLVERLFDTSSRQAPMWEVVVRVRREGIATALLSNSWGREGYPTEEIDAHFDAVIISGEVGLRKPDPDIYRLAAERLNLSPEQCVFVDDLDRNVEAARDVGMTAIHHRAPETTIRSLERVLGLQLSLWGDRICASEGVRSGEHPEGPDNRPLKPPDDRSLGGPDDFGAT